MRVVANVSTRRPLPISAKDGNQLAMPHRKPTNNDRPSHIEPLLLPTSWYTTRARSSVLHILAVDPATGVGLNVIGRQDIEILEHVWMWSQKWTIISQVVELCEDCIPVIGEPIGTCPICHLAIELAVVQLG